MINTTISEPRLLPITQSRRDQLIPQVFRLFVERPLAHSREEYSFSFSLSCLGVFLLLVHEFFGDLFGVVEGFEGEVAPLIPLFLLFRARNHGSQIPRPGLSLTQWIGSVGIDSQGIFSEHFQ